MAGKLAGTLFSLTVTTTDETSGLSSPADPFNVVVGGNTNDTIHLAALPGIATAAPTFISGLGGIDTIDGGDLLIFLDGDDVVRFTDYRGSNTFEGFERPFAEIPREDAVFSVRDRVVRPTS